MNRDDKIIKCAPQSWMASRKTNRLIIGKKAEYIIIKKAVHKKEYI